MALITKLPTAAAAAALPPFGTQPVSTDIKLFEDFFGNTINDGTWWYGKRSTSGVSLSNNSSTGTDDAFGAYKITVDGTASKYGIIDGPHSISKPTPLNGEACLFESRLRINTTGSNGEVALVLGGFNNTDIWQNDYLGFKEYGASSTPHRVIVGHINGESNWRYASGNTADFTGSSSDTGVACENSTYTRLAIKCIYNSSDADWDWTIYINGSSVATGTLDDDYQLGCQLGMRGFDSSKPLHVDWISCQFKRDAIDYLTL